MITVNPVPGQSSSNTDVVETTSRCVASRVTDSTSREAEDSIDTVVGREVSSVVGGARGSIEIAIVGYQSSTDTSSSETSMRAVNGSVGIWVFRGNAKVVEAACQGRTDNIGGRVERGDTSGVEENCITGGKAGRVRAVLG